MSNDYERKMLVQARRAHWVANRVEAAASVRQGDIYVSPVYHALTQFEYDQYQELLNIFKGAITNE